MFVLYMPIRVPKLRLIPYINKKDVGFCTRLSHLLGSRIALPKDKQRISPRRAVYKRPLTIPLHEMLHFVQHDKVRPQG